MPEDEQQPWWNDSDKAGGLAGTIFMLGAISAVAILMIGGAVKLVTLMF